MSDQRFDSRNTGDTARPGSLLLSIPKGRGRTAVRLDLLAMGRDYLLLVHGGQVHAGAAALAAPGQCHLAVVPPHKEGPLAEECGLAVADASGSHCAVVCGIHQDGITSAEIQTVVEHVRQALAELIERAFVTGRKD